MRELMMTGSILMERERFISLIIKVKLLLSLTNKAGAAFSLAISSFANTDPSLDHNLHFQYNNIE